MKKQNLLLYVLLAISVAFTACKKDDVVPLGKYQGGVLVVNEGSFGDGDGSISFLSITDQTITNAIFNAENSQNIGGIVQNLKIHENKAIAITNKADQIIIANATDFKKISIISQADLVNPINFAGVGNKGYVTQWGATTDFVNYPDAAVRVVDLDAGTITKTIALDAQPQGILAYNNKIYVALQGSDKIVVINPSTDAIEATITVAAGPSNLGVDANGKIWAMCTSGNFVRINPGDNTVEATISGIKVNFFNEKFTFNKDKTKILYLSPAPFPSTDTEIFAMDITATAAPTTAFITGNNFYGLGVSPDDDVIYVANSAAFQGNGKVERYKADGSKLDEFSAGRGTSNFVF
ncbi:MAG TPA: hypothetical protein DCS93_22255 [Microscillaceae bacterium]|nr:hypothetical protein [Microscillaceae bacterium]